MDVLDRATPGRSTLCCITRTSRPSKSAPAEARRQAAPPVSAGGTARPSQDPLRAPVSNPSADWIPAQGCV